MRPVDRGPCPKDEQGADRTFVEYGHARPHLINRLGDYCSFCEMQLSSTLDVEHIRHKHGNPALEREWSNFLLACKSCNSTKGTKVETADDVAERLWPHQHRTADVFLYGPGGRVGLVPQPDPEHESRAQKLEQMVGLTRRPGEGLTRDQVERGSDNRWKKRWEAWDEAITARTDLTECDTPLLRKHILTEARHTGFWSVWMTVFRGDPQMQVALCKEFRGTAEDRVFPLPPHMTEPSLSSPLPAPD